MHDYSFKCYFHLVINQFVGIYRICWVAATQTLTSDILVPLLFKFTWHHKTIQEVYAKKIIIIATTKPPWKRKLLHFFISWPPLTSM